MNKFIRYKSFKTFNDIHKTLYCNLRSFKKVRRIYKLKKIVFSIFSLFVFLNLFFAVNVVAMPGWIYVSTPSSYSTYYKGDTISITWSYNDIGNYVKIDLYRSGSFFEVIDSNTTNDGEYYWLVDSYYSPSYSYSIKVTSLADSSEYDYSGLFYIKQKSIEVNSPDGNDLLYKGDTTDITWSSENIYGYVKIEVYEEGSYYSTITSYTNNDGSYSWNVPTHLSSSKDYKIKISSISEPSVYDYSEEFNIGERSIEILFPTGGETLYKQATYSITWNSGNAGSYVNIKYRTGYSSWYTIGSRILNDGDYDWTIPSSVSTGSQYKIKVESYYYNVFDISNYFAIDERSITISEPTSYSEWYPNQTYTIEWNSQNAGDKVDISLFKNDFYVADIAFNVNNTGSYTWTVSNVFKADSDYSIVIRSQTYDFVTDETSDFSIGERYIQIIKPSKDITLYKGDSYQIEWESENIGNYVDIHLLKNGEYFSTIGKNVDDYLGYYNWEVPDNLEVDDSYSFMVSSVNFEEIYDTSDAEIKVEETLVQQISNSLGNVILIVFIVGFVLLVVYFLRKKFAVSNHEEPIKSTQSYRPYQSINEGVSSEEYDEIWEK